MTGIDLDELDRAERAIRLVMPEWVEMRTVSGKEVSTSLLVRGVEAMVNGWDCFSALCKHDNSRIEGRSYLIPTKGLTEGTRR